MHHSFILPCLFLSLSLSLLSLSLPLSLSLSLSLPQTNHCGKGEMIQCLFSTRFIFASRLSLSNFFPCGGCEKPRNVPKGRNCTFRASIPIEKHLLVVSAKIYRASSSFLFFDRGQIASKCCDFLLEVSEPANLHYSLRSRHLAAAGPVSRPLCELWVIPERGGFISALLRPDLAS